MGKFSLYKELTVFFGGISEGNEEIMYFCDIK